MILTELGQLIVNIWPDVWCRQALCDYRVHILYTRRQQKLTTALTLENSVVLQKKKQLY